MSLLRQTIRNTEEIDAAALRKMRAKTAKWAIPQGSLGRLEELAALYASIRTTHNHEVRDKVAFTMAGDHGVVAEGVSAFPQEVTRQMVQNFLNGGAAVNVLARHVDARVVVVDCGVAGEIPPGPGLRTGKIGHGTGNIAKGPAMSTGDAVRSIELGIETLEEELPRGADLVAVGDMGIGNTTPSSAILAVLSSGNVDVREVTGQGTGVNGAALTRKQDVVAAALEVNQPDPGDPIDVLAKVGGFEIGAIAGVCLAAARHRRPVIIDGFISSAGALLAARIEPKVKGYLIAAHLSTERGHRLILEELGMRPVLDLEMRLGEGTGALLAMSIVEAAVKLLDQMATFSEAGVSESLPE
ncbi:MAG: nicotinate-nucleotide--dimethylbenzimidazole phosphoribosyltransferase [Planctomycetes bacterium]|nr:nicotinate-nucleotide--dimethylbenzimidazole phosphoribosyltransferase [Planctomycetota bacterium]